MGLIYLLPNFDILIGIFLPCACYMLCELFLLTIIRKLGYILYRSEEWNGGKIEAREMKFLRGVSEDVPN